jgi:hypothetical protein
VNRIKNRIFFEEWPNLKIIGFILIQVFERENNLKIAFSVN